MSKSVHLIVLHFGLWGNPSHMEFLEKTLVERLVDCEQTGNEEFKVINPDWGRLWHTYDGIDQCGERVVKFLKDNYFEDESVKKISLIGYSMGGLVLRYAAGLLYLMDAIPQKWTPCVFITLATPHVGVSAPPNRFLFRLKNAVIAWAISKSGTQLVLHDKEVRFQNTTRPLLLFLADPRFCFWQALSSFQRRIVFANVVNDRAVPFTSAAIELSNVFHKPDIVPESFLDEFPSIVKPASGVLPKVKRTWKYYVGWTVAGLASPVLLPLFLLVLTYVSMNGLKHRLFKYKRVSNPQWLEREFRAPDDIDSGALSLESSLTAQQSVASKGTDLQPGQFVKSIVPFGGVKSSEDSDMMLIADSDTPTGDCNLMDMELKHQRKFILDNLSRLDWERVYVKCKFRNAHAAIITRADMAKGNEDVVYYLIQLAFSNSK